jgi:hypothetical protein
VQSQQLPKESQVLEDEVLPGTENADQPAEEMPERHDHSRNYIGKVRSELCAKSFILKVYDVLARQYSQRKQGAPARRNLRSMALALDPTSACGTLDPGRDKGYALPWSWGEHGTGSFIVSSQSYCAARYFDTSTLIVPGCGLPDTGWPGSPSCFQLD